MSAFETQASAAATELAEAVRKFNHATIDPSPFGDPADVYRLLGDLVQMAHRLPQALEQLARIIDVQRRSGECGIDDGTDFESADAAMNWAAVGLQAAAATPVRLLGEILGSVQQTMAPIYTTRQVAL